jgi:hypothetical protein
MAATPPAGAGVRVQSGLGTVVLPTGDQIHDTGQQRSSVTPAASTGLGRILVSLTLGAKQYELPAAALPYLGRGLDLSLFEVAALRAAERDQRIPVEVTYQGSQPTLPGITMTGAHTGYLTADSARSFGAALVKQFLADRTSPRAAGGSGLFPNGLGIALAGAKTAPVARPHFPMKTLTFTGTDASGKPDNLDPVVVFNLDDSVRIGADQDSISNFYNGSVKFSVPAGNYAAMAYFFDTDTAGNVTGVRVVSRPQFTVSDNTTMAVAASEATSKVTMLTARPAQPQEGGFVVHRTALAGPSMYFDVSVGAGAPIWVAPTKTPVTIGKLDSFPYRRLTAPAGAAVPYQYFLQYPTSGVIPRQFYVASPANTATIDASFYSDIDIVGAQYRAGTYPFESDAFVLRPDHTLSLPIHQLDYVSTGHSVQWFASVAKYTRIIWGGFEAWYGGQYDGVRQYSPGQRVRESWNAFPLHPAGPVNTARDKSLTAVQPSVVRAGDKVVFALESFSDNEPGHTGFGVYGDPDNVAAGTYEIDQDGKKVAGGDAGGPSSDVPTTTLGAAASTVRLVLDATREGPKFLLSTKNHTEWTWRSQHQQGTTLPVGYQCDYYFGADRNCAVEPLMTTQTTVGGMSLHGTVPAGPQRIGLRLGHLQLAQQSAITGAKVEFSTDDGKTWQPATVRPLGDGNYSANFSAGKGFVSLRVSGADAAGGTISETVTRAYQLI